MHAKMYHHSRIPTILGVPGGGSLLPPELQACEYLKTDGNSYIVTNINSNNLTFVKLKCQQANNSGGSSVYGCGQTTNPLSYFQLYINESKYAIRCFSNTTTPIETNVNGGDLIDYHLDITNKSAIINNNNITITNYYQIIESYTLFTLFASRQSSGIYPNKNGLKIYNCETNLFNLFDCYIKAGRTYTDNKGNTCTAGTPGMYDILNNVFYTNDGTGNFTAGPDINI